MISKLTVDFPRLIVLSTDVIASATEDKEFNDRENVKSSFKTRLAIYKITALA